MVDLDASPNFTGLMKLARASTSGMPMMPKVSFELMRLDAERGLEQKPGAGVEEFEETRIEYDAGRVAIAPGNGQLSAVDE